MTDSTNQPGSSFTEARLQKSWGRMAAMGPSGTGKTYTLFRICRALFEILPEERRRLCVVGGEAEAAVKYKSDFPDIPYWYFQPMTHSPETYIKMIDRAVDEGFGVLIIDSLSNPWASLGGTLEIVDAATEASSNSNKFTSGWSVASPMQNRLVQKILTAPIHILATLRVKTEYKMGGANGTTPKAVGLKPIQKEGIEYEFDVLVSMNADLLTTVETTRCAELRGQTFLEAGENDLGKLFSEWLDTGSERTAKVNVNQGDGVADSKAAVAAQQAEGDGVEAGGVDPAAQGDLSPPAVGSQTTTPARDHVKELMRMRCITCAVDPNKHLGPALNGILERLKVKPNEEALAGGMGALEDAIGEWAPEPSEDGIPF